MAVHRHRPYPAVCPGHPLSKSCLDRRIIDDIQHHRDRDRAGDLSGDPFYVWLLRWRRGAV